MILLLLACAGTPEPAPEPAPDHGAVAPAVVPGVTEEPTEAVQATEPVPPTTPIELTQPAEGATISGGQLVIAGSAQVFEGHVNIKVTRGDELLSDSVVTVAAAPEFGAFELSIPVSPGPARIEVYSRSARDGSPENLVVRNVVLE